ncbi:hypothetical protein ACWT_5747 [Actinoplanes sp. SE50]|uniref:hypothetical protein n=1 Tax=unclassified Actinoplanes TaxID=2626549 RepID=UPI00023ED4CF|nr:MULTISPECIES: hypothetical protein [unclassified Actinoplanes]AEV86765.1 hypothetical protein ACPL_5878 [Actinoplanes sp. SE50/110]ATO85162.1 hypothetical protein ACWT_5747 [Actinoplanes sp. SE50]SLM02572.1 hypothetical protein ACSP50_5854 [Actinoplanes sp. SE50/110]
MTIYGIIVVILLLAYTGIVWWAVDAVTAEAILVQTLIAGAGLCALIGVVQILLHAGDGPVPNFGAVWITAAVLIGGALVIFGIALRIQRHKDRAIELPRYDHDVTWENATASDIEGMRDTSYPPR